MSTVSPTSCQPTLVGGLALRQRVLLFLMFVSVPLISAFSATTKIHSNNCARDATTQTKLFSVTTQSSSSAAATGTASSAMAVRRRVNQVGSSILTGVKGLASKVAFTNGSEISVNDRNVKLIEKDLEVTLATRDAIEREANATGVSKTSEEVRLALANLERDMQMLDILTGEKTQLSLVEFTVLSLSVLAACSGPVMGVPKLTEVLAPASAAVSAAIGIGAEYVGKVAVATGKEVAAASILCAAESDGLLAQAERAKAVTPLCVGVGATAASFAALAPTVFQAFGLSSSAASSVQLLTELYLLCPLVSVLAAAIASLAFQETQTLCGIAMSVGNRRFAKSGLVGKSWLSSTEQIERKAQGLNRKWQAFGRSVIPAPLVGALMPGSLPTKTILVAALAAAQSAYFLAQAEYVLSKATDAVSLKARSAAVCDTYANQGARSAAILPFTSALSGLCAAATAAVVELPFFHVDSMATLLPRIVVVSIFPSFSALFAAAASVSKARCEVDAEAAVEAACTLALEYEDTNENDGPVLRPLQAVRELIRLTAVSVWRKFNRSRVGTILRLSRKKFIRLLWPRR